MKNLLMRLDWTGRILEASPEAHSAFGACEGLECARVVKARGLDRSDICRPGCVPEGRGPGTTGAPERHPVQVQGRIGRLTCTPLGRGHVVCLELSDRQAGEVEVLTTREREVLQLVSTGRTTNQIAQRLGVSPATVRTHVEHARDKLGARTRAEAVMRGVVTGQIG